MPERVTLRHVTVSHVCYCHLAAARKKITRKEQKIKRRDVSSHRNEGQGLRHIKCRFWSFCFFLFFNRTVVMTSLA